MFLERFLRQIQSLRRLSCAVSSAIHTETRTATSTLPHHCLWRLASLSKHPSRPVIKRPLTGGHRLPFRVDLLAYPFTRIVRDSSRHSQQRRAENVTLVTNASRILDNLERV